MADYIFERETRTPCSEAYLIVREDENIGRVDLHFTSSAVYATVCVPEDMSEDDMRELVETVDEELVMSADVPRDDFIATVFQGREVAVYSDEDEEEFEEEEEQPRNGDRP